jgi:hypothetical protein
VYPRPQFAAASHHCRIHGLAHSTTPTVLADDQSTPSDEAQRKLMTVLEQISKNAVRENISTHVWDRKVEIERCLQAVQSPLTEKPLIYTVLSLINQIQVGDEFVKRGCAVTTFPFSVDELPLTLEPETKKQFLQAQIVVVTPGVRVEKGGDLIIQFDKLGFDRELLFGRECIIKSAYTGKNTRSCATVTDLNRRTLQRLYHTIQVCK